MRVPGACAGRPPSHDRSGDGGAPVIAAGIARVAPAGAGAWHHGFMADDTGHPDTILAPGTRAPDFTLAAAPDRTVALGALAGNPVVLVFYPADWSSVCGDELLVFNQALPLIAKQKATVLGISVDSVWCHQAYRESRTLQFDLLADYHPKGAVGKQYGIYDSDGGFEGRALFVIDADGVIAWSYLSPTAVNPGVDGVLDALDGLVSGQ